jgi:ubiquinone/menaquinone biosynthesis C-methylase UbiE
MRYTVWAGVYDALLRCLPAFDEARRRSIRRLDLSPGERVLIVGAGTGLDLPHVPHRVRVVAVDVTPAMLARLRARAREFAVDVDARVMDARELSFPARHFDAVIMHPILAVMPEPAVGLREAERVLVPGGRVAVFDKFLPDDERPSVPRRVLNVLASVLFSDMNRRLGPIVAATTLVVESDEPAAFGRLYRVATLRKPLGGVPNPSPQPPPAP